MINSYDYIFKDKLYISEIEYQNFSKLCLILKLFLNGQMSNLMIQAGKWDTFHNFKNPTGHTYLT